jgi:hypothetical protein
VCGSDQAFDVFKKNGIVDLLGVGEGALAGAIRTFPRRFRGNVRRTRCRTNIVRAQVTAIVNDKVRRFTRATATYYRLSGNAFG